jgi:Integrase zinc binding domain
VVLCHKCLECVGAVEEDLAVILTQDPVTVAEMRAAQEVAYGEDGTQLPQRDVVRNEDGLWCRVLGENDVRVFVPPALRRRVIMEAHGSASAGHWGVLRTAAKVRGRCFWEGWNANVEAAVKGCLGCEMERMRKPGRQGKLVKYHPTRRLSSWRRTSWK